MKKKKADLNNVEYLGKWTDYQRAQHEQAIRDRKVAFGRINKLLAGKSTEFIQGIIQAMEENLCP